MRFGTFKWSDRLSYWLMTKYYSAVSCAFGKHRTHMDGVSCHCNCHWQI